MGREERRQVVLPVPARTALRLLFSSAGVYFQEYHREFTQDPSPCVGPWDASRRRVVTFKKKLDVPGPVLKLLGDPCVSVTETQELCDLAAVGDDAGQPLVVTSTAVSKGFEKFKTTTTYRFAPDDTAAAGGASCTLEQVVCCEAPALGFGMQGLVEKCMCTIAAESLEQQMRLATEFVRTRAAAAPGSPLPGEPPALKTRTPRAADADKAATLRRSVSLKRRRGGEAEETDASPTTFFDAVSSPVAEDPQDVSPATAQLTRKQSLRRRVTSPEAS